MSRIGDAIEKEPVATAGLFAGVVTAGIAVAISFGAPISVDQKAQLDAFVAVVLGAAATVWARGKVTPVAKLRDKAVQTPRNRDLPSPYPPPSDTFTR